MTIMRVMVAALFALVAGVLVEGAKARNDAASAEPGAAFLAQSPR